MSNVPEPYKEQVERVCAMFRGPLVPAKNGALPPRHFVTITEALTWIAFGVPLEPWAFSTADQFMLGPFARRENFVSAMAKALSRFNEEAAGGSLEVRGRYVENYSNHAEARRAATGRMTPAQLRDFARYDSLYVGLQHGEGLGWEETPLDQIFEGRRDGWRDVEVRRANLEKEFSPGRPMVPTHDEAVQWCADWLERNNNAGQKKAWPDFARTFPGSARDIVFRPAFKEAKTKSG